MDTIPELRAKAAELRRIADKLEAAASALADLGGTPNGRVPVPAVGLLTSELGDLSELSGLDAIERVLRESGGAMTKKHLSQRLRVRGKAIGTGTLEAYLSRAKKNGRFANPARGVWALARIPIPIPGIRSRTRSNE